MSYRILKAIKSIGREEILRKSNLLCGLSYGQAACSSIIKGYTRGNITDYHHHDQWFSLKTKDA